VNLILIYIIKGYNSLNDCFMRFLRCYVTITLTDDSGHYKFCVHRPTYNKLINGGMKLNELQFSSCFKLYLTICIVLVTNIYRSN
jgi:hypothetical protein